MQALMAAITPVQIPKEDLSEEELKEFEVRGVEVTLEEVRAAERCTQPGSLTHSSYPLGGNATRLLLTHSTRALFL